MSEEKPQSAVEHVLKTSQHKRNTGYVLIKLAQCIDAGNPCPSFTELAEMTGLSKPTIQSALGELEKDGTVSITRRGGDVKRGGKKNCYALPGMTADPVKPVDPVKEAGKTILPGKSDPVKNPGKADLPGKNAEDARTHESAAGEQKLLSQDSLVQSNPDKTRPVANSEQDAPPVNMPATTYAESLAAAPPKIQADANALIAKAQPADNDVSSAPPPDAAEPPAPESPEAHDYWRSQLPGFGLSTGYKTRLNTAVKKYGFDAVRDAINAARLEGSRLDYPMAWVERRLENQQAEGKLNGKSKPAQKRFVSRTHLQGSDLKPAQDYPDEMQFEPPPPKAETKGAIAAWS